MCCSERGKFDGSVCVAAHGGTKHGGSGLSSGAAWRSAMKYSWAQAACGRIDGMLQHRLASQQAQQGRQMNEANEAAATRQPRVVNCGQPVTGAASSGCSVPSAPSGAAATRREVRNASSG
jgi:hypothetical protein